MGRVKQERSKRVTLASVAEHAGVSTTTVSLILSGREEWLRQFHPDTVAKVRKTAERLGYHANVFAAGLPTKLPAFFALVVRDFGGRQSVHDWHLWAFEGRMLAGAVRAAAEKGLYPIVATINPDAPDAGVASIERIVTGGVLGAIVRAQNPPLERFLHEQLKRGLRLVVVFPDQISKWTENAILADNLAIGQTAARLLAAQGRKRWGIIRYKPKAVREPHALRIEGFQRFAEQVGVPVEIICRGPDSSDYTKREMNDLRKRELDGLFAVDSVLSVGAFLACRKLGLEPGRDVSLVGVNCSQWRGTPLPAITSIDISWSEVGRVAVQRLVEMSESGRHRFQNTLVQPKVVSGASCPVPEDMLEPAPSAGST